jgi:hypothetical protein
MAQAPSAFIEQQRGVGPMWCDFNAFIDILLKCAVGRFAQCYPPRFTELAFGDEKPLVARINILPV